MLFRLSSLTPLNLNKKIGWSTTKVIHPMLLVPNSNWIESLEKSLELTTQHDLCISICFLFFDIFRRRSLVLNWNRWKQQPTTYIVNGRRCHRCCCCCCCSPFNLWRNPNMFPLHRSLTMHTRHVWYICFVHKSNDNQCLGQ